VVIGVSQAAGFYAHDDDTPVAYVHVAPPENDAPGRWSTSLLADARVATWPQGAVAALRAAQQFVVDQGGGTLVLWEHGADPATRAVVEEAGFHVARELHQMRVPLPLEEPAQWPPGVTRRTFRPGVDDAEWLRVNNAAFAGHAEQGNWTEATLRHRMAEPWFDPSLFFLAVAADDPETILGFNWCKVHPASKDDGALGEIYVIGVDPGTKPLKLGRPLALTGLDAMARRGAGTGMLYTAADNAKALHLYGSLGFTIARTDRAYECNVQP